MARKNAEIARQGIEQLNAGGRELGLFASDVLLDNSNAAFDGAVYHGHDGVREWLSWAGAMWKRQQIQPREFIPVGDDQVIVPVRLVSIGRDDVETVAQAAAVLTVREGKITRLKTFQRKSDAVKAAGAA
jgi:ketosteroid isomerase-like protein